MRFCPRCGINVEVTDISTKEIIGKQVIGHRSLCNVCGHTTYISSYQGFNGNPDLAADESLYHYNDISRELWSRLTVHQRELYKDLSDKIFDFRFKLNSFIQNRPKPGLMQKGITKDDLKKLQNLVRYADGWHRYCDDYWEGDVEVKNPYNTVARIVDEFGLIQPETFQLDRYITTPGAIIASYMRFEAAYLGFISEGCYRACNSSQLFRWIPTW